MKLPAIPFLTKTIKTDFFLSLIFETDKISSILFKEQEKNLVILASHEVTLDLENASVEDLVIACDNVISRLEMSLPEGAVLEKTIFAVPYSWVDEGKIKQERLSQLKKVSEELALTPMGFIVSIEAIIAFLQKKDGVPVSGIFVELAEKYLTVFVARSGNIIDIKTGEIMDGVEKTVERLLGSVTKLDVLPSKIVLLHNKEAEEISQKFLSHHWTKDLSFMHLPQVAILDKGFENEAIINGVATQLNVTVRGDVAVATIEEREEFEQTVSQSSDSFGFLQDEDIAIEPVEEEQKETPSSQDFEFTEEKEPLVRHHGKIDEEQGGEEVFEEEEPAPHMERKRNGVGGVIGYLSGLITPKSVGNFFKMFGTGRRLIIPFAALVAVALLLTAYYSVILKAKVIIFTDQKAFTKDAMAITLTTDGNSSFEGKTLRISTVNETVEGEQSQETTGQKDTGEKATGSITIFNKSESPKQIEKGTTITSSNNLEFTLNDSVNIASTSSFATSFSSAQAKVTASNFGKEYNLPSQTNFTIKGIATSTVFGRNDSAFSGGTKEEIQIVSKKDLQGLEESVTERLFDKVKDAASSKLSADEALVPSYLSITFKEKNFDRKENEQAKTVKLTATADYSLGVYKKDELANFISSSDEFDVPADFKLSGNESSIKITDIKQSKNSISAKLSFNAVFKPQLKIETVPQEISGKTKDDAITKLKSVSGVSDIAIQFTGNIPFLPQILPLNKDNIEIEQKAQE